VRAGQERALRGELGVVHGRTVDGNHRDAPVGAEQRSRLGQDLLAGPSDLGNRWPGAGSSEDSASSTSRSATVRQATSWAGSAGT
jgi:hypothetical protein